MDLESCYCDASWEQELEGCSIFLDSSSLETACAKEMFGGNTADIAHASQMQLEESSVNIADYFATGSTTLLAPLETMPANLSTLPYPYTYPYQFSGVPCCPVSSSFTHANFLQGSSFEESPLSSPGSDSSMMEPTWATTGSKGSARDSPLVNYCSQPTGPGVQATPYFVRSCSTEQPEELHSVKMPQSKHLSVSLLYMVQTAWSVSVQMRVPKWFKLYSFLGKGGIQLWQFLYALLTDSEHKHPELIEWTCNREEREFRFLEPEAIAVWWGHHKNKLNLNYNKFSRSLRYYYDKGILKKIPGHRFVYRFCVDPADMYKHIGVSDCTHQIKPMPEEARRAIQSKQNCDIFSTSASALEGLKLSVSPPSSELSHCTSLDYSFNKHGANFPAGRTEKSRSFDLEAMTGIHEEFPRVSSCPSLSANYVSSWNYLPTMSTVANHSTFVSKATT